jgi:hypothetical protein
MLAKIFLILVELFEKESSRGRAAAVEILSTMGGESAVNIKFKSMSIGG